MHIQECTCVYECEDMISRGEEKIQTRAKRTAYTMNAGVTHFMYEIELLSINARASSSNATVVNSFPETLKWRQKEDER